MLDWSDLIVGVISLLVGGASTTIFIKINYSVTKKSNKKSTKQIIKGNNNTQAGRDVK